MSPWCNISPATSLQPRNPSALHRWCNKHSLANLFLPHATVMQHLSSLEILVCCINDATNTRSLTSSLRMQHLSSLEILVCCINDATNTRSLASSFHMPLWCSILSLRIHGVLHQRCNKHSLVNLFLPHSIVMQHLSVHQRCNKRSPLIHSSRRHSDATSLSALKLGPFLWFVTSFHLENRVASVVRCNTDATNTRSLTHSSCSHSRLLDATTLS